MFKFIHAADPHLDSPFHGLSSHPGAPAEALRHATRRAFANLVRLAIEERVDFIVLAGDLYDGDWRDYGPGLYFTQQMAVLKKAGIPVYLISGNHDAESIITRRLPTLTNVHWFSTRKPESKEVAGLPVVIHGQGFPDRKVPENLSLLYPDAVAGKFNLGLLHTSLQGRAEHDTYAPCSVEDLLSKHYDYWALGHIHQPEVLHTQPFIGFAGNLQGRHIRETGPRGCNLVTVADNHAVTVEFRPLDVIRWELISVDIAGLTDESTVLERFGKALESTLQAADGRMVAARIHFNGATALHGTLHRQADAWYHQCLARALELTSDGLWLEQLKFTTTPLVDPARLAERDDLTRVVLESLQNPSLTLPEDLQKMLKKLPPEVATGLRDELTENPSAILADVSAIILESLSITGGEAA